MLLACSGQATDGIGGTGGVPSSEAGGAKAAGGSEGASGGKGSSAGGSVEATGGADGGRPSDGGQPNGGAAASGGASATGGAVECGPCPGAACAPPLMLTVQTISAQAISFYGLEVTGADVTLNCNSSSCGQVTCTSESLLADGHYSVEVGSPAFTPKKVEFHITNPTDCGCCGCCPGSAQVTVTLDPVENPPEELLCCADLASDDDNCGACGNVCTPRYSCRGGECIPTP
jgi:hypothetical protein